ncbi:MAG: HAD family phosphatase [Candidatus Hydrogenedentota bacterium]|nr:MAG: HAD family phosphatase [Candidatus Hydrogenedentota bacterium]
MTPSGILLDFNGVLVDDEPLHCRALQGVLRRHGLELTEEEYWDRYLAYDDRESFRIAFANHGLRPGEGAVPPLERLLHEKLVLYLELLGDAPPYFPGAVEVVRTLSKNFRLALVSGARRIEIEKILQYENLTGIFQTIVASDDVKHSKPDPESYLLALERLSASPSEFIAVEDSLGGIRAAKAAGLDVVAVTHTYPRSRLESETPFVLDNIRELPDFFSRRFSAPNEASRSKKKPLG